MKVSAKSVIFVGLFVGPPLTNKNYSPVTFIGYGQPTEVMRICFFNIKKGTALGATVHHRIILQFTQCIIKYNTLMHHRVNTYKKKSRRAVVRLVGVSTTNCGRAVELARC
jgi:hypothetical protein